MRKIILLVLLILMNNLALSSAAPLSGQIMVDPQNPSWLVYNKDENGDGKPDPFFMAGPGDPEDFLYRGSRNSDGTRNGDQMTLITKLKGTGANSIYMQLIRSHGGDGDSTHNPFINNDPSQGINTKVLDQWETWFTEMDNNRIVIFLFFYDDSARIWNTGDTVGSEEKSFIQTVVNRFEHHKNLIWVVAEEYQEAFSAKRVSNIASEIRAADDHSHIIAVHKLSGLDFSEFADDPNIDQFAIQYNVSTPQELHNGMITASNNAAGRYNLNMSEAAGHGNGAIARQKNWAVAMGGAYVMALGWDIANTPVSDLQDAGRLVSFMQSTNFNEMAPHDELRFGGTEYVLAKPGTSYIAYVSNLSGNMGLKGMTAGTYDFRWYDVTNGTTVTQAGVSIVAGDQSWTKPATIGNELAVYIKRTGNAPPSGVVFPGASWQTKTPQELGLDGAKLNQLASNVGGNGVIVKDGYIVKTWGSPTSKGDWASAFKPVVSTMLFFAVHEGKLTSVDSLIDPWWNGALISKDKTMKFRHLADMTSGYARGEAPGAAWAYNDYAIKLYVMTLFDKVYQELANAAATKSTRLGGLQFQDGSIFSSRGGYGVYTSPRDFARIGWFWLNKGNWNGTQLLPKSYFDNYMKVDVPKNLPRTTQGGSDYLGVGSVGGGSDQGYFGPGMYGFNWWFNAEVGTTGKRPWPDAPDDMFMASGHGGLEQVVVYPSLGIVAAAIGNWGDVNDAGNPNSTMNNNFKLLKEAATATLSDPTPPSTPTNLISTTQTDASVSLSWSASSDPESGILKYIIYKDNAKVGETTTTNYTDSNLAPETTYTYQVSSVNGAGLESAKSAFLQVTTKPYIPGSELVSGLSVLSGKTYQVVEDGLNIGATTYIDRSYTFTSIPSLLQGSTYIKTANGDKGSTGATLLSFDVNQEVTLYIAHDNRITTKPSWLASFTDTDLDLSTDDTILSLFSKDYPAGKITLGGNEGADGSMYSVIVIGKGGAPLLKGDVNIDSSVDILDVQALVNHILGIQDYGSSADVNGDGSVDVLDVQAVVNIILG